MKRRLIALIAALMATVSLSGCWWGWWDHDRGRHGGHHDRGYGNGQTHDSDHDGGHDRD